MTRDPPRPEQGSEGDGDDSRPPAMQQLYESIWLWAAVAVLFWILSYVVWGFVDLTVLPGG